MATVAGVNFPCSDCKRRFPGCRVQREVFKAVFLAIGHGDASPVECEQFEPAWFRGLEGVKP